MSPKVSVVIVTFRSRPSLERCLDSLDACASRLPLEVIVVDNASGDGPVESLRASGGEVFVIANPDNRGFTRGVNQGLERARASTCSCSIPTARWRPTRSST
jgi:GT2 family glycosyltransferase